RAGRARRRAWRAVRGLPRFRAGQEAAAVGGGGRAGRDVPAVGQVAARIEPEWAEPLAEHLVKRAYSEPHWDARRGAAMALEKVTLYGLPIVTARKVNYARVDPAAARDLFITSALVEGDWQTHHTFFHRNQRLLDEARELEDKAR